MIVLKSRRLNEKDLLAFCNELSRELGGGEDGLKFGLKKNEDGSETLWLFGKKIKTED